MSDAPAIKQSIRGVAFDMDGTLTVPCMDFGLMRSRIGVPDGADTLDTINSWPADRQAVAYAVIFEMESEALKVLQVMPGATELCAHLDEQKVPRGLITRNIMSSVDVFHTRHFPMAPFRPAVSRDSGFAYKPSPEALLHLCTTWGITPDQCVMVGDSIKDDIVSGNRAGCLTIYLDHEGQCGCSVADFEGEERPHFVATSLQHVQRLLMEEFELLPPPRPVSLTL